MNETYTADGDIIFANGEPFLKVLVTEPVREGYVTIERQAELVAELLNKTA